MVGFLSGGEHPALDDLHGDLRLHLVPGAADPRGQHDDAVVAGEVVVGLVQVGLVAMGAADRGAQIVGDDQLRQPP